MFQPVSYRRPVPARSHLKLFSIFAGLFVASLLLANITASKMIAFGPFIFTGGIIVFPISYIFGDILTEVYGYARSRKIIWTGLACQVLAAVVFLTVGLLPPAPFWHDQEAYNAILGFVPRIAVASVIAYFCGEFCNSWILSRMKYQHKGQRGLKQAWRFVASTMAGEGVDTLVFIAVAFSGVYGLAMLLQTAVSLYVFKVGYEILLVPLSSRFADWVKEAERIDQIDRPEDTNYNPFNP